MIEIRAIIEFNHTRKVPFFSGYRPAFLFIPESYTSGQITLIDRERFNPGETGEVEIKFLNKDLLGKTFGIGSEFTFEEPPNILGTGRVLEILSSD